MRVRFDVESEATQVARRYEPAVGKPRRAIRYSAPQSVGEALGQAVLKELSGATGKRLVRGILGSLFKAR